MCTTCGCGAGEVRIEGHGPKDGAVPGPEGGHGEVARRDPHDHHDHEAVSHRHAHHRHHHDGAHQGHGGSDLHYGTGPARSHAPGLSQSRMVEIETAILAKNDRYAVANRQRFAEQGILALNLVSSPGSGKTTLLVRTIERLSERRPPVPIAVIEGDQETANDADRIRATGVPALQVNTGKGCHLDAHMVGHALDHLQPADHAILFIENVGNLVCPAAFDLGEAAKVAILSVTEGEDKPLKYPDMFAAAEIVLLNKVDLAPHCDVDLALFEENIGRVNPAARVLMLSARTGEGMEGWIDWLMERRDDLLGERLARLEAERAAILAALGEG